MQGKNAEAKRLVLTDNPIMVVKRTYNPAPAKPAPPVPLPHAARLKCP